MLQDNIGLKNKVVIISGGLGDIGRAIAKEFAKAGANIAIGDIFPEDASFEIQSELKSFSVTVKYNKVDVSIADSVHSWVREIEEEIGPPNIIIANAAIATFKNVIDISPKEWTRELEVNLNGSFFLAKFCAASLIQHNHPGKIIFIGSWAGHAVHNSIPAYCVSKAGLRMLCQCMALEFAPYNILVNELALGYVDAGLSGKEFKKNPISRDEAINRVPIKRLLTAEEVALQVLSLCSSESSYLTGSTILMDGGLSLLR